MHYSVWVITSYSDKYLDLPSLEDRLENDSDRITEHFYYENLHLSSFINGEEVIHMPTLYYDWKVVGGRWDGDINNGKGGNYALCRDAAKLSNDVFPKAIITPDGRYVYVSSHEEKAEIRRVLLNWPNNIVLGEDWHN